MKRLVHRSLRFRLIAACVLIEMLMLSLIVGNSMRLVQHHLLAQAQGRVANMEETFSVALAAPLAARDHAVLRSLIQRLSGLDGVVYLTLEDAEGVTVGQEGTVPPRIPDPDATFSDATTVHHGRLDIDLYGQPLGRLHYGLSTDFLSAAKREVLLQGIAIATLEIFFSTFALITVGLLLTARLETLTDASLRVAAGDLRTLVEVRGNDEVAALGHAFNTMAEAIGDKVEQLEVTSATLRASNAELQRLAEVAAHHLQEPVRGLVTYAQLLERHAAGTLDDESRDYLDVIVAGAKRTRGLLLDLQSYVAIDMSPVPADSVVDLGHCARDACAALADKVEASQATVTIEDLPRAHGDADQITTVLRLLLENAMDHRGDQPPVIRIHATPDSGRVVVGVSDNGPGVPREFRERVFELFETLGTRGEGTGFGLAAVRKIVRRHHGNVWITPGSNNSGLTVNFTLPKAT